MSENLSEKIRKCFLPATAILLFVICYYPAFQSIIRKWLEIEDYSHAFLAFPVVLYMFWMKRQFFSYENRFGLIGFITVVLTVLLYLLSLKLQIPTFIYISTAFSVVSVVIFLFGFRVLTKLAVPFVVLFLLIPIPHQLLMIITSSLQMKVSQASELIITAFSIPLFREGNIIHIPNKTFQVVEACSGIRALISMATLGLIIGYFTLSRWWSIIILLMLSLPVALIINVLRVVSFVSVYHIFGMDLTEGTLHTLTGVVLFVFGLSLLYLSQKMLLFCEVKSKKN